MKKKSLREAARLLCEDHKREPVPRTSLASHLGLCEPGERIPIRYGKQPAPGQPDNENGGPQ